MKQHGGFLYQKYLLETGGKLKLAGSGVEHIEMLMLLVGVLLPGNQT